MLRGRVVGRVQVGPHARHVTVDPTGRTLWIALGSKAAESRSWTCRRRRGRGSPAASDRRSSPTTSASRRMGGICGSAPETARSSPSTTAATGACSRGRPATGLPSTSRSPAGRAYVASGWSGTLRCTRRRRGRSQVRSSRSAPTTSSRRLGLVVTAGARARHMLTVSRRAGRLMRRRRVARSSHDACSSAAQSAPTRERPAAELLGDVRVGEHLLPGRTQEEPLIAPPARRAAGGRRGSGHAVEAPAARSVAARWASSKASKSATGRPGRREVVACGSEGRCNDASDGRAEATRSWVDDQPVSRDDRQACTVGRPVDQAQGGKARRAPRDGARLGVDHFDAAALPDT